jgi:hypothetical protein
MVPNYAPIAALWTLRICAVGIDLEESAAVGIAVAIMQSQSVDTFRYILDA